MKKCIVFLVTFVMLFHSHIYAMPDVTRNETVYIGLDDDGRVKEINIYQICMNNTAEKIIDYTPYSEVTNLTNKKEAIIEEGNIVWNVEGEERFSYTGKVGEEFYEKLPWNFNITYQLNGVEVEKEDLLGANGLIKIEMEIKANDKALDYYKNNYMLEVTASYDMSDYLSIHSEEAMIVDTGNTKTLMFIVLPGQSTNMSIEIGASDFQMDGITMAAVPITGEIRNQLADLVKNKDDIENAASALDESTDILFNSLKGMNQGLNGISYGVNEIKKGTKEIQGLGTLRDEEIENLKEIFNRLQPLLAHFNLDLENLNTTYKILIEMSENLNAELKELKESVEALKEYLLEIEDIMEDLPKDISTLQDSMKTLSRLTGNLNSLLKGLESGNSENQKQLVKSLTQIGEETKNIGEIVTETVPEVSGDVQNALLGIGNAANKIGKNVVNVQEILEEMSSGSVSNVSEMSENLKDLKSDLNQIAKMLDEDNAKTLVETMSEVTKTTETLEEMLGIVEEYSDKLLENSGDFGMAIENMKSLSNELQQMDVLSINMLSNLQTTLHILDNEIYSGADKTTDSILSVNNELIKITKESDTFINSKNTIKDIVKEKWNDVEDKTNIFHMDEEAKVVSFGSEKNENVNQVEFLLKTPDIKKVKEKEIDLESTQEKKTFWDRIVVVLNKMFGWILNLFR